MFDKRLTSRRKSLAASNDLTQILHEWAEEDVLLRADHFFWLLGSGVQKTVDGLLRSLLHSLLLSLSRSTFAGKPEALKHICATRSRANAHCAWSRSDLREMLIRLTSVRGVKSFVLVDALDECEPQDRLGDIANEMLRISQLTNVKLCVSHRRWEIFTRKFTQASILRLDSLTLCDMETYVRARLTDVESEIGLKFKLRRSRPKSVNRKFDTQPCPCCRGRLLVDRAHHQSDLQ